MTTIPHYPVALLTVRDMRTSQCEKKTTMSGRAKRGCGYFCRKTAENDEKSADGTGDHADRHVPAAAAACGRQGRWRQQNRAEQARRASWRLCNGPASGRRHMGNHQADEADNAGDGNEHRGGETGRQKVSVRSRATGTPRPFGGFLAAQ